MKREISYAQLQALKTTSSFGSHGADGEAVEFWISDGGGAGSLSGFPLNVPYYWTTVNLLEQLKVSTEWLRKRRKQIRMKGHSMSLGIDVTHGVYDVQGSKADQC